jgi:hypothetical protein
VAATRLLRPLAHDPVHVGKRGLDFREIRLGVGFELMAAEATHQLRPELKLAQPHLERLLTSWAGDIDSGAPEVIKQAVPSFGAIFNAPIQAQPFRIGEHIEAKAWH